MESKETKSHIFYKKGKCDSMLWLAVCNSASILGAASLVLVLQPEDRISIARGSALTALGLVYYVSLFELLNAIALCTAPGAACRTRYQLSVGHVLDITNKVVSAVQAVLCAASGAIVCCWSCPRDLLRSSHFMSEAYAWFGAAYFFYDIWSMYMVHVYMTTNLEYYPSPRPVLARLSAGDARRPAGVARPSFLAYCRYEPVILFHHLFIGGFGFLVITYLRGGLGDCVFGWVYLMEISTPFVSIRGILSRLQLKDTPIYTYNGLLMLATFFVCRVCSLPYVALLYSRTLGLPYFEALAGLPRGCKVSICILLLPQLYWFILMARGALRVLRGGRGAGAQVKGEGKDKRS